MRRTGALAEYPALAAAWDRREIGKSHLRVILAVVGKETEPLWVERGRTMTVRQLENEAREARRRAREEGKSDLSDAGEEERPMRRRTVMAPPGVAILVAEAVEMARKVEGYQVGAGQAVAMMAMEMISALPAARAGEDPEPGIGGSADVSGRSAKDETSPLGDHRSLEQELGPDWEEIHRRMEEATARWAGLPRGVAGILITGAPAEDADPHERVVFWTAAHMRLDAVRGRLLRMVQERRLAEGLGFAGLGQYVREQMGLSLREARDLIRLDRTLSPLKTAFRMYAAGRLGKRAAWLIARVANRDTERAWTRYALTHTCRLLEAAVEAALLTRDTDHAAWSRTGGMPPDGASFPDVLRTCSLLKAHGGGGTEASAPIVMSMDPDQEASYRQAVGALSARYGEDRPEWFWLAVMARYFIDSWVEIDRLAIPVRLRRLVRRRVIERDNYTCCAPECLQRGGLEADHIHLRARNGPTVMHNMVSLAPPITDT